MTEYIELIDDDEPTDMLTSQDGLRSIKSASAKFNSNSMSSCTNEEDEEEDNYSSCSSSFGSNSMIDSSHNAATNCNNAGRRKQNKPIR